MFKTKKINICFSLLILVSICVAANAKSNEPNEDIPVAYVTPRDDHPRGGPEKLEGENINEAVYHLNKSLTKLSADENGPHFRLVRIHEASRTVVSGLLYRINADIIDDDDGATTKNCNITIWTQLWMPNGNRVTFNCGTEPEMVRQHSH
ncbi:sarcocystatin-A-like isoform X2 [Haematobia irritans]|uniref:sarcocystatin-A-like isoform X2 n=1 Tax=Haematobia irritans TaxID=7368 RepID=UPI003F502F06